MEIVAVSIAFLALMWGLYFALVKWAENELEKIDCHSDIMRKC